MYSLMLGTKTYVVLSSDVVVKDLLDKRSAIYSDRPDLYTSGELLSGGMRVLMMVSVSCLSSVPFGERIEEGKTKGRDKPKLKIRE